MLVSAPARTTKNLFAGGPANGGASADGASLSSAPFETGTLPEAAVCAAGSGTVAGAACKEGAAGAKVTAEAGTAGAGRAAAAGSSSWRGRLAVGRATSSSRAAGLAAEIGASSTSVKPQYSPTKGW